MNDVVLVTPPWFAGRGAWGGVKQFTGIGGVGSDGASVWYPSASGPRAMEPGIRYRIDVRDGQAHLTPLDHPFDV